MQSPRRSAAYWLALHSILSFLSYRTQDSHPRGGTTHNGLGPLHLLAIKKMFYSWILWRHSLNQGSSFQMTIACVKMT